MRIRAAIIVGLAVALGAGSAFAKSAPSTEQIRTYAEYHTFTTNGYSAPDLVRWELALKAGLMKAAPDAVADQLAPQWNLSRQDMRELVSLWLDVAIDADPEEPDDRATAAVADQRRRTVALVRSTGHARLSLLAAAEMSKHGRVCAHDDFVALSDGAKNTLEAGWTLVTNSYCEKWVQGFIEANPQKATAALLYLTELGGAASTDTLALRDYLTRPENLARVAPGDQSAVETRLLRDRLQGLFDAGLAKQAVALVETLPADQRATALHASLPARTISVDGLPIELRASFDGADLPASLAAAYFLLGRPAEAEAALPATRFAEQQAKLACRSDKPQARADKVCGRELSLHVLLLDAAMHALDADRYPLIENAQRDFDFNVAEQTGVWSDVTCLVFREAQYAHLCDDSRRHTVDGLRDMDLSVEDRRLTAAVLDATRSPVLDRDRAAIAARSAAQAAAYGGEGRKPSPHRERASVDPLPSPFAQAPLPAQYRDKPAPEGQPDWIKQLSPLPQGYAAVRADRDGLRVVIVSVSQNYDPTGEVSSGGYWVHLSHDGGKTWDRPLYTGLAERFPYVVEASSPMPLLDGDALNLAVSVEQVDTASITYPPVGLGPKRQEKGLYLRIRLAELARDSDGDGLTDIAARHLLLDRPTRPDAPYVVGSRPDPTCHAGPSGVERAMGAVLEKVFSRNNGAIVEPVRAQGESYSIAGWRGAASSLDRPIFVHGDRADFVCMTSARLMIVYSDANIAELARVTPDFHAVTLSKPVFNRTHDRGFVTWSAGWTGGAYVMRLVDGAWVVDEIGTWIT